MSYHSKISQTPADRTLPCHKGTMIIQGIPASTKAAFKAKCYSEGNTMRDVLILLMREYVKRKPKPVGVGIIK